MNDQAREPKKTYRKPEIIRVPLTPADAVLGGCKSVSGGPGGGSCARGLESCSNNAS